MSRTVTCEVPRPSQLAEPRCPNNSCDAMIRLDHMHARIDEQTGIRIVRAYCPHCDSVWKQTFELRGGIWNPVGMAEKVTDAQERKSFKSRIDHLAGGGDSQAA